MEWFYILFYLLNKPLVSYLFFFNFFVVNFVVKNPLLRRKWENDFVVDFFVNCYEKDVGLNLIQ